MDIRAKPWKLAAKRRFRWTSYSKCSSIRRTCWKTPSEIYIYIYVYTIRLYDMFILYAYIVYIYICLYIYSSTVVNGAYLPPIASRCPVAKQPISKLGRSDRGLTGSLGISTRDPSEVSGSCWNMRTFYAFLGGHTMPFRQIWCLHNITYCTYMISYNLLHINNHIYGRYW